MHHKRRSRRKDKALYAPCGCCIVGYARNENPRKTPIEDGSCMGKKRGKKKSATCPKGGKHKWVIEIVTYENSYGPMTYKVSTCARCFKHRKTYIQRSKWRPEKKLRLPKRPVKF